MKQIFLVTNDKVWGRGNVSLHHSRNDPELVDLDSGTVHEGYGFQVPKEIPALALKPRGSSVSDIWMILV